MPSSFNEETVEKLAVEWLGDLCYESADRAELYQSGQRQSVELSVPATEEVVEEVA